MTPAPLAPRVAAGAIDTVVVLVLCAAYFLVPLLTRGLVLPMWGVLAAVLGYLVVPLSAYKRTLGMKLTGLELVTKDGHAVGPGDVLFRELLGRGFFPAAFLFTMFAGLVASWLHLAAFVAPTGIALLFFFVSSFALALAVLGHVLVLTREDRRSIADLMARSHVRIAVPEPAPSDAEEAADRAADAGKKLRTVLLFELVLFTGALALPWLLTQKTETKAEYAARLQRQKLEAQVKASPDDHRALSELARAYAQEGRVEEAAAMRARADAVLTKREEERVAALKAKVAANPQDERALAELLDVYDGTEDWPAAKAVYRKFLEGSTDHELRAGFGRWLWKRGFHEEAIAEVKDAQKRDPALEGIHSLLGRIMGDCDRLEEAQVELHLALLEDPDDADARTVLEVIDEEIGPLAPAKLTALKKTFHAPR